MYLEQCNEDQLKKVYEEFSVTEETVQRDVKSLMEWLEQQPYLPNVKDESLLRLYLLRCKASLERAKRTLESYYIFKAHSLELFMNRDPTAADFSNCYHKVVNLFIVPKLTPEVNRVMIFRIHENVSANELPNVDAAGRIAVTATTLANVISGIHRKFILVLDYNHLTASMLPLLLPNIRRLHSLIFEHFPMRIEAMYVLNSSVLLDPVLTLTRKLLKKTVQERLIIWKKSDKDLAEAISKESLPNEYGGTAGNCNELSEHYFKELESWKGWIDEDNKYIADLSKIPEDYKKKLDMGEFGVEGSFRKLGVD